MFWKYYELCKLMLIIKTFLTVVLRKSYLFCYFLSNYIKMILKTTSKFPTINYQTKVIHGEFWSGYSKNSSDLQRLTFIN